MDTMSLLAKLGLLLITAAVAGVATLGVASTTRRVLGVRVGWPRAFLVASLLTLVVLGVVMWIAPPDLRSAPWQSHISFLMLTVVFILWGFALAAGILVVLEVIVPSGSLPQLRDLFFGWDKRRKKANRTIQIFRLAKKHGLARQLRGFRTPELDPAQQQEAARNLRLFLDDAGVTFTKLGQMFSTREDLLNKIFSKELSKLTTDASQESWEVMKVTIEEALERPLADIFLEVEQEPIAAASVAQVHGATLLDGRQVVIKVQRPQAVAEVELDLEILKTLTQTLVQNAVWARKMHLDDLIQGFSDSLREELDYYIEVDNMLAISQSALSRGVKVPKIETQLCTENLIVMERFDGVPVSRAETVIDTLSSEQRDLAADRLLTAVMGQIIEDGIFHADLHSGNVLVWPDGSVGLLDFGNVGRLDAVTRQYLALLFFSVDSDDPRLAMDAVLELLPHEGKLDEHALERDIGIFITRVKNGVGSGGTMKLFQQLLLIVAEHGFSAPDGIAQAFRSMGALEGTLHQLSPNIDLVNTARATSREVLSDITSRSAGDKIKSTMLRSMPLFEHLPRRINQIGEDLQTGKFSMNVRLFENPADQRFVTGLVQQLVTAILAGAAVLAAVLLVTSTNSPVLINDITLNHFLGYLLGFGGVILALRSVALIFWRDRKDD